MNVQTDSSEDTVSILIVEDSRTQAEQLKYLLEQKHYRVMAAENGKQALALLEDGLPTLVITDIIMPEMNGYELCKRIKADERTREIPVILLTSLISAEDVLEGLACGADNFLTKPYSEKYLLSSIETILAGRKLRKSKRVRIGLEIMFAGKSRFITADQQQMLGLLISTYEAAVLRNTELTRTQDELRALNERLEDLVEERTAALSAEVIERKQAEEREKRLNAVLRAIRGVNQLITKEKDRERLIREACSILTSSRGFNRAWIALVDETGEFLTMAESGLSRDCRHLIEAMKRGEWPRCALNAFAEEGVAVIEDTAVTCRDCLLADYHGDHGALASRLAHDGKVYGVMAVYIPVEIVVDKDERDLFQEVVGDVAFGLNALEQDEKRIKAETALRESGELYRTELERRVTERTAQLEAANRELDAFAYTVSHDLRAPLRAIDGFSRILLADHSSSLDEEGKRVGSVISQSARNMARLIDDLLAFSRIGRSSMRLSPVDMETLATSIFFELTTPGERERIDFHVGPLPRAQGDPALVRQVWMNLLSNAVKFSAKKERAVIEVSAEQREEGTVYTVRDNGAGFDMQYADKLFGVFQRLHSVKEFEGTGVGMAIVQRIVHRHGGRIRAEGEPGKGATFHFTLGKGE